MGEETKYKIEKYIDYELIDGEIKEVIKERKVPYTDFIFEIQPQTFECQDGELDKYLEHITKTYGKYGEVTVEHKEDPSKEPTETDKLIMAVDALAKSLTLEKLNIIRLKSDLSGVGEETVKIKLENIQGGNV